MLQTPRKSYRIVQQQNMTYGVEISDGKSVLNVVTSFATETLAARWAQEQRQSDLQAGMRKLVEAAKDLDGTWRLF
jgi:hypothetical protein